MVDNLVSQRIECKYFLTYDQYISLKHQLGLLLHRDKRALADRYLVRSLYFDTINNSDYDDKLAGVYSRQKVRLRTYNPALQQCRLEIKQKMGEGQTKIGVWLDKSHTQQLIKGDCRC